MYGPSQAVIGTNVSINCSIAVEGDLNPDIHITTLRTAHAEWYICELNNC